MQPIRAKKNIEDFTSDRAETYDEPVAIDKGGCGVNDAKKYDQDMLAAVDDGICYTKLSGITSEWSNTYLRSTIAPESFSTTRQLG